MKNIHTIKQIVLMIGCCLLLVACGGNPEPETANEVVEVAPTAELDSVGDANHGEEIFSQTCSACHGPDGKGITGLGKDMTSSEFIGTQTDDELVSFLQVGRASTDPLNTTGVDMPPKGGNPVLSEDDLLDVIAFIRELRK